MRTVTHFPARHSTGRIEMISIRSLACLAALVFSLTACSNDDDTPKNNTPMKLPSSETAEPNEAQHQPVSLKILLDDLRIRQSPTLNGEIIEKLDANNLVQWLGDISPNTDAIRLRGVSFDDPWLKIATASGKTGWGYAAAMIPVSDSPATNALKQQLYNLRAKHFFGESVQKALLKYQQYYQHANTDAALADVYTTGLLLRDDMVQSLEQKANVEHPAMDMSWLSFVLPGFDVELVAEATQYYLLANFKTFAQKASKTSGKADDDYFAYAQDIYPYDGQEGFFYSWFEQTWDYGGDSLLGQGKHLNSLSKMDQLLKQSPLFTQAIKHDKNSLVKDITSTETNFRESADKIKKELQQIIDKNFAVLTDADKKAIRQKHGSL